MPARAAIVLGFLGAPLAWAVHLGVSYFLVALGCTTNWGGARPAILVATLAFAALAVWAGWIGWRGRERDPAGVRDFLGMGGAVLAGLFTLAIVFAGLSPLVLPLCGLTAE
jgi:hypothetical protein